MKGAGAFENVEQFEKIMLLHRHAKAGPMVALKDEDPQRGKLDGNGLIAVGWLRHGVSHPRGLASGAWSSWRRCFSK